MTSQTSWRRLLPRCAIAIAALLIPRDTPAPTLEKVQPIATARSGHNLVVQQDGRVAAFFGKRPSSNTLASTLEIYDPRTGSWTTDGMDSPPGTMLRRGATATLLQDGRVLIAGGADASNVILQTTVFYDPRAVAVSKWSAGPSMGYRRTRHTATLLKDGKVLIAGGASCSAMGTCTESQAASLGTYEVYNPATGTFPPAQSMPLGSDRFDHAAVLVASGHDGVAGDVRLFGGFQGSPLGPHVALDSTLLYSSGTWCWGTSLGLGYQRARATATLLPDGDIAVVGGTTNESSPVSSLVVYDPEGYCGTEVVGHPLSPGAYQARWRHTASLLPDGRLIITGGSTSSTSTADSVQLLRLAFSSATVDGVWTGSKRTDHAAAILPTGEVLIVGGQNPDTGSPPPAPDVTVTELFDPRDGGFCTLAPIGNAGTERPLQASTAQILSDGRVLVAFGEGSGGLTTDAFLFDPAAGLPGSCADQPEGLWIAVPDRPISEGGAAADDGGVARRNAPAVLLPNGSLLVIAGEGGGGGGGAVSLSSVRIFNPLDTTAGPDGTWREAEPMREERRGHTTTLLKDGRVLVGGGLNNSGTVLDTWEVFDPMANTWADCASVNPRGRYSASATLLLDGRVLIVGGRDSGGIPQTDTVLFDPGTDPVNGSFTVGNPMTTARAGHTCATLPGGCVLAAFGDSTTGPTNTSEIYEPSSGIWVATNPAKDGLLARQEGHRSALLLNGKVLAVGGFTTPPGPGGPPEQEVFDPELAQWFGTAEGEWIDVAWTDIAATVLLPNGRVLVAGGGGGGGGGALSTARAYDLGHNPPESRRPVITSAGSPDGRGYPGLDFRVTGSGFGSYEASGGNAAQHSSTGYPILHFQRIEDDLVYNPPPKPATWTHTGSTTTLPPEMLLGRYRLSVVSSGVPSVSRILRIEPASPPEDPDSDGDGFGVTTDCNDLDLLNWATPGEARSLTALHDRATGKTTLHWNAPVVLGAVSVVYDTLRSLSPSDFVTTAACLETDDGTDTQAATHEAPPLGQVLYYLVRAQNNCPAGEGSLGTRSDGTPRIGRTCP